MKYKIGVFGSAEGNFNLILNKARELGKALGKRNVILITGATTGLPYEISLEAYKNGSEIWGFSAAVDFKNQKKITVGLDNTIFSKLFYIPRNYQFANNDNVARKYRNITSTVTCDAGIIVSGRWGTLNEFSNLYDFGKVIGVLTGTGGIADELSYLNKKIHKPGKAEIYFNDSPKELIEKVLTALKKRQL